MCAGSGTRWGNYLGVPKQMIEIRGEPILHRTIRQLSNYGINDITVSYKPHKFKVIPPAKLKYQELTTYDIDRFCGAVGFDLYLYGDVFYTDKAMKKIMDRKTRFYGRAGKSQIKKHGEIFAVYMDDDLMQDAWDLRSMFKNGEVRRCLAWELYRKSRGMNLRKHIVTRDFTEINDETDDFDHPVHYDRWTEKYGK